MLDRYSTPEMTSIWSQKSKIKRWVRIEQAVNDVLVYDKTIPENILSSLLNLTEDDYECLLSRMALKEIETGHDVVAFLFALEEFLDHPDARWIHYGLTSSDLLDTATAMAVKDSIKVLNLSFNKLWDTLFALKKKTEGKFFIGRTHGQYAEHLLFSDFFELYLNVLSNFRIEKGIPGKISGAVGNYRFIKSVQEYHILQELLLCEPVSRSDQIVPREYYAKLIFELASLASTLEKLVLQIRLYQQSGIDEMFEPFSSKQTGSSAMPKKRNPILCENITGLSRLVRSYVTPALENIPLWHQRDISHSSVERVILPDIFNLVHFMLKRTVFIFENLEINFGKIEEHIQDAGIDSQSRLLELVREGKSRQEAYRIVQKECSK